MKYLLSLTLGLLCCGFVQAKNSFLPGSFSLEFRQEYKSQFTNKLKKTYGYIDYKYPSQIRFAVTKPKGKESLFISNKKKSWFYTPPFIEGEKGQATVNPKNSDVLSQFFDTLKKGLKTNEFYKVEKKKEYYLLSFKEEVAQKINVEKAHLYLKNLSSPKFSEVNKLAIFSTTDKNYTFYFSNFKSKVNYKSDHFSFPIPENTNFLGE